GVGPVAPAARVARAVSPRDRARSRRLAALPPKRTRPQLFAALPPKRTQPRPPAALHENGAGSRLSTALPRKRFAPEKLDTKQPHRAGHVPFEVPWYWMWCCGRW